MVLRLQLKNLLAARGMTASQLARACNIPKQTICDWMSGVTPRNLGNLKLIADFFSLTIDELCFGEPKKPKRPKMRGFLRVAGLGVFDVEFRSVAPPNDVKQGTDAQSKT